MRSNQIDLGTRRPKWELGSIIAIAEEGNFRCTFNLLIYFVAEISSNRVPEDDVVEFVLKTLHASFSDEKRRTRERHFKIKEQIDRDKLKATVEDAILTASADFHLSPERVKSIYYDKISPISQSSKKVSDGWKPNNELLIEVAKEARKMLTILPKESDKGERLRSRLNLKGYKDWDRPTAEHEEITQEIQRHIDAGLNRTQARRLVAQESKVADTQGYSYENVKKIDQRKLERLKQDIRDLVDSGVPSDNAIAIMAQVSDMHVDKFK